MSKSTYVLIFIILAYLAYRIIMAKNGANSGELAPDITSNLVDGSEFALSDLKGNYILIDFWGSWCAPCRRENPMLVALHNKYKGTQFKDAEGFEVVTVALEKNDKTWRNAAEKDGFNWKYQIVEQAKFVALSSVARNYGVTDLPTKFLINPKGELIGKTSLQKVDDLLSSKQE